MTFEGRAYSLQLASDLERDGMVLELFAGSREAGRIVADVFYSDVDGTTQLAEYEGGIPEAALSWLREQAARRLPPRTDAV